MHLQKDNRLNLVNGAQILLNGHANSANIFWQTAEGATMGTSLHFIGNILMMTDVAVQTDETMIARLLAQIAVTLDRKDTTVISEPAPHCVVGFGEFSPLRNNHYENIR